MAIQMATPAQASAVATAHAHEDCMGVHSHSHGEARAHAATPADTQPAKDHCASCASCQACFTVALSTPVLQLAFAAPGYAQPDARLMAFTSAVPALGQKPPIS